MNDTPPTTRPRPRGSALLEKRIAELAFGIPELAELAPSELDALSRAVATDELKRELHRAVVARRINWDAEIDAFLSDCRSTNTRRVYQRALSLFSEWLSLKARSFVDVHAPEADEYIRDLRAESIRDADTVRVAVAAVSAFYTFLERRYEEVKNPFRGSKARPVSSWTESRIPTEDEISRIIAKADPLTAAAVAIVSETGMRIGALPGLTIKPNGSYTTVTKGKKFNGAEPLSRDTRAMIKQAGLPARKPFDPAHYVGRASKREAVEVATSAERIIALLKMRLLRVCDELAASGLVRERYSWHDLRHAYAESHADHGLRWLSKRLGHASIAVTERYLRNKLAIDTEEL